MRRGVRRVAAALLFGFLLPAGAETLNGVAVPNIAWESPAAVPQTLADVRAHGFDAVRIGWKGPFDKAEAALRAAAAKNLAIVVTVPVIDGQTSVAGAKVRPETRGFFPVHRLSDLDPAAVEAHVAGLLDRMQKAGVSLAGIEIGNEMNWSGYNGDLPVMDKGVVVADLAALPAAEADAFRAGVDRYAQALGRVDALLEARFPNPAKRPALILGGLADVNAAYIEKRGATYVEPALARRLLGDAGALESVSGMGVHLYEPLRAAIPATRRETMMAADLSGCGAAAFAMLPCWITEYGIAEPDAGCALGDEDRRALMRPFLSLLAVPANQGRIAAAFYYDWDGDDAFSLKRCGHVTDLAADLTRHPGADDAGFQRKD